MHRSRALFVGLACAVATLLEARRVPAQVTSGPTVNATLDPYPHRIVNGADLGETTRPMNLTPLGISYSDCAADMTLNFNVSVAGFDGTENLQIWASRSSDCTAAADRGIGGATVPLCWLLGQDIFVSTTASTRPYSVRVQDAVGPQNNPPAAGSGYQRQGPEACHAQSTYTPVPINIAFVPVDSSGNYVGTGYKYPLQTDLVGPPAPTGAGVADGDTLFIVNWTPNIDADTTGYDVYIDPTPGTEGAGPSVAPPEPTLVCPESGAPVVDAAVTDGASDVDATDADASDADASDADASDGAAGSTDAGCYYVNVGGSMGASCNDPTLSGASLVDGGAQTVLDDAGNSISVTGGGISTIDSSHLISAGGGLSVSDKSTGTYTVTGLRNGTLYSVVVAAVDAYGNIGPPSAEACATPAPVNDFWNGYRADGGQAGGGFCALEAVGAPRPALAGVAILVSGATLIRRRRRRQP